MANVRVAVRVRPLIQREVKRNSKNVVVVAGDTINVINLKVPENSEADSRERMKQFTFDCCYWHADADSSESKNSTQEVIFKDLGMEMLDAMFDGYNACMLAYGPSGSGKTFTMMGQENEVGLIPRICKKLYEKINEVIEEKVTFCIDVSYSEIYNERVRDLLQVTTNRKKQKILKVREHPKLGPYVQDLSRHKVTDFQTVLSLLKKGNENRSIAATENHQHSSRSHAIFTINCTQARLDADLPSEIISKIQLVDLAGSERASNAFNKVRLKESSNINKSLVTLGNVISALADKSLSSWSLESLGSTFSINSSTGESVATTPLCSPRRLRQPFVPYRDSVLTWLLKDSLGGNSKTIMITTVSPASICYAETINTLRYAQRTKCIVNSPVVNEEPNVKLIRQLRAEIARLRNLLISAQVDNMLSSTIDKNSISEILNQNENKAKALTSSWIAKWHYTLNFVQDNIATETFSDDVSPCSDDNLLLPHFIVLDNHILSTGIHIYYLKKGRTTINKIDEACNIIKDYCHVEFDGSRVTLSPLEQDSCQINGRSIFDPVQLCQADIIKLGNNYTLRFNHPSEVQKLQKDWTDGNPAVSGGNNTFSSSSSSSSSFNGPPYHNCHDCFYNAEPFANAIEVASSHRAEINENNGCNNSCPLAKQIGEKNREINHDRRPPIDKNNEHATEDVLNAQNLVLPGSLNFSHDGGVVIPELFASNGMTETFAAQNGGTCVDDLNLCGRSRSADSELNLGLSAESSWIICERDNSRNNTGVEVQQINSREQACLNGPSSSPASSSALISPDIQSIKQDIYHDSSLSSANDLKPNENVPSEEECVKAKHFEDCCSDAAAVSADSNFYRKIIDHRCHRNHLHRCCVKEICKLHPSLSKNGESLHSMTELISTLGADMTSLTVDSVNSVSSCCGFHDKWKENENTWNLFRHDAAQFREAESVSSLVSEDAGDTCSSSSLCSHPDELVAFGGRRSRANQQSIQVLNNRCELRAQNSTKPSSVAHHLPKSSNNCGNENLLLQLSNLLKSNNLKIVGKKYASPKCKRAKQMRFKCLTKMSCCCKHGLCKKSRWKTQRVKLRKAKRLGSQTCWNTSSKLKAVLVRAYLKNALSKPIIVNSTTTSVNAKNNALTDGAKDAVSENSTCNNGSEIRKDTHSSQKEEVVVFNTDLMNDIKNFINLTKDITDTRHIVRMLRKDALSSAKVTANGHEHSSNSKKVLNIIKNFNNDKTNSSCGSCEQALPNGNATASASNASENKASENCAALVTELPEPDDEIKPNEINTKCVTVDEGPSSCTNKSSRDNINGANSEKSTWLENGPSCESEEALDDDANFDKPSPGELKRTLSVCFGKILNGSTTTEDKALNTALKPEGSGGKGDEMASGKSEMHWNGSYGAASRELLNRAKCQHAPVSYTSTLPSLFGGPEIVVEDSDASVVHETSLATTVQIPKLSLISEYDDDANTLISVQATEQITAKDINLLGSILLPDNELKRTLSNTDIQHSLQMEDAEGATNNPSFCPSLNHPPKVRTNSWPEPSQLSLEQLDSEIQDLQEGLKVDLVNDVLTKIGDEIGLESDQSFGERIDAFGNSETQEQFSDSLEENDDKSKCWHRSKYFNSNADIQTAAPRINNGRRFSGEEIQTGVACAEASGRRSSLKLVRQRARVGLSVDGDHTPEEIASSYSEDSLDETKTKTEFEKLSPCQTVQPSSCDSIESVYYGNANGISNGSASKTNSDNPKIEISDASAADDVSASYSDDFESDDEADENNSNAKEFEDCESSSDEEIFYIPADPANPNWSLYYVSSDDNNDSNDLMKKYSPDAFRKQQTQKQANSKQPVANSKTYQSDDNERAETGCDKPRQVGNQFFSDDGFFEVDDYAANYSEGIEKVTLTKLPSATYANAQARDIDEWENEDFSVLSTAVDNSSEAFMADSFSYCPASSVDVFIDYRMIPTQERRRLYTIPELSSEYSSTPSEGLQGNVSEAESVQTVDDFTVSTARDQTESLENERTVSTPCAGEEGNLPLESSETNADDSSANDKEVTVVSPAVENENPSDQSNTAEAGEDTVDCKELWQLYKRFSEESDEEANGSDKDKQKSENENGENGKVVEMENCQQDVDDLLQNLEIISNQQSDSLLNDVPVHEDAKDKDISNERDKVRYDDEEKERLSQQSAHGQSGEGCELLETDRSEPTDTEKLTVDEFGIGQEKLYHELSHDSPQNAITETCETTSQNITEFQGQRSKTNIDRNGEVINNSNPEDKQSVAKTDCANEENAFIDFCQSHEDTLLNERSIEAGDYGISFTPVTSDGTLLDNDVKDSTDAALDSKESDLKCDDAINSQSKSDVLLDVNFESNKNSVVVMKSEQYDSDVEKYGRQTSEDSGFEIMINEDNDEIIIKENCNIPASIITTEARNDFGVDNEAGVPAGDFLLSYHDLHLHNAIDSTTAQKTLDENSHSEFDHASNTTKGTLNSEKSAAAAVLETRLTSCNKNDVSESHHPKQQQQTFVESGAVGSTFAPPTRNEKSVDDTTGAHETTAPDGEDLFCSNETECWEQRSSAYRIDYFLQDRDGSEEDETDFMYFNSDEDEDHPTILLGDLEVDDDDAKDESNSTVLNEQNVAVVCDDGFCSKTGASGFHPKAVNDLLSSVSLDESSDKDSFKAIVAQESQKATPDSKPFHLTCESNEDRGAETVNEQWNFESWLSHLPYAEDQNERESFDELLQSGSSLFSKQAGLDTDDLDFSNDGAAVIAALGSAFHSDIFGYKDTPEATQADEKVETDDNVEGSAETCVGPFRSTANSLSVRATSPDNVPWIDQRFVRESSITPDSLENFQQSELEHLTSWQNNRNLGQQTLFTIRTSPATCKQPLDANVKPLIEDPWGTSSDSITFVFMGPSLGKSSSDPSAVLGYMDQFDDPGVLMLRSASLDCINRHPKCFGMLPYTLNTRASSMESMIPEDLMGVVERGRIHEIGSDEIRKSQPEREQPFSQIKATPSKTFSQSWDICEKPPKKSKKSVSWGDLSGCGLTVEENNNQRPATSSSSFLPKPIIKISDSKHTANVRHDETEKLDYTDNDVEDDLKNSALYARIQKKCQRATGIVPPASFKLKLPSHVKARMNRSKSENTLHSTPVDEEQTIKPKQTEYNSSSGKCVDDQASDSKVNALLPPVLAPFTQNLEKLLSSKKAATIAAQAAALQDKIQAGNPNDLSVFLSEIGNIYVQLSLICDQNEPDVLNSNGKVGDVFVSTVTNAAIQTDLTTNVSVSTNTESESFSQQQSDCILTSLYGKQLCDILNPAPKETSSLFSFQCCSPTDLCKATPSADLQNEHLRRPFSTSLSSIPRVDSDSASGSPSSSASVGRAVQVNTLLPRTSSKRSWLRREACLRKELEILRKEKENVLCQLENYAGSGDDLPPLSGIPDNLEYLFTYHGRLQNACVRIANKLEKLARARANEDVEKLSMQSSWSTFPRSNGSSLSISSSDYVPLRQDAAASSNPWLSSGCWRLSQSSEGGSISSLNTCGSEPLRLRPRDYRAQLVNFRRNLIEATRSKSNSPTRETKSRKASSSSSEENGADDNNSSAEDIQALLRECRVARAKAKREIELAQQQLTAQRSAVKSLETVLRHRTS